MTEQHAIPTHRTREIAVAEIRYGIAFADANETFWRKLDTLASVAQVVAGSLAFAGVFTAGGELLRWAGAAVAALSGLHLVLRPLERAVQFRNARIAFHDLHKRAWTMDLLDIDAALEDLRAHAPRGSSLLAPIALNRANRQMGHPATEPVGFFSKLAGLLV